MILFNDFKRQWLETGPDTIAAVETVGSSGWYVLGKEVQEFEAALAARCGVERAVGVASGLDAIELSLKTLGCRPGEKVLTTPISAFATTLAIVKAGGVPVFCDCDQYGLVDLSRCFDILRSRGDIHYFIPVHLYGHALNLERLEQLRSEFDLGLVEDCAQAIGATHLQRPVGTAGRLAAASFYPTKNLGALGDAGAVLTSDEVLAARIRRLRDYGQSRKYEHEEIGYNSRLDELQAAILHHAHLPRLDSWTARRRYVASAYVRGIDNAMIRVPGAPPGSESCWHLFPIFIDPNKKGAFITHMRAQGVTVAEHYPQTIFAQRALAEIAYEVIDGCRNATLLCQSEVSLPIHPYLGDDEIESVIKACNGWNG